MAEMRTWKDDRDAELRVCPSRVHQDQAVVGIVRMTAITLTRAQAHEVADALLEFTGQDTLTAVLERLKSHVNATREDLAELATDRDKLRKRVEALTAERDAAREERDDLHKQTNEWLLRRDLANDESKQVRGYDPGIANLEGQVEALLDTRDRLIAALAVKGEE